MIPSFVGILCPMDLCFERFNSSCLKITKERFDILIRTRFSRGFALANYWFRGIAVNPAYSKYCREIQFDVMAVSTMEPIDTLTNIAR
jgi:hypothetical protein